MHGTWDRVHVIWFVVDDGTKVRMVAGLLVKWYVYSTYSTMVEETRVSFTAQQLLSSASYTLLHLEGPSWSDHQALITMTILTWPLMILRF